MKEDQKMSNNLDRIRLMMLGVMALGCSSMMMTGTLLAAGGKYRSFGEKYRSFEMLAA